MSSWQASRGSSIRTAAARFAGAMLLLLVFAGCATQDAVPAAAPATAKADPAEIFLRNCSACHGERGDGRGLAQSSLVTAPRDFTTDDAQAHLSREYMIAIARDGRPHTAMVGRSVRLTHEQIEAAVDFIRTAFLPPEPGTARARGRTIYRQSCAQCHGDRGQGSTFRPGQPASPAISRARARPELTAERMAEAISRPVHVPAVAAFALKVPAAEVAAVVEYVRTAFIEVSAASRREPPAGETRP